MTCDVHMCMFMCDVHTCRNSSGSSSSRFDVAAVAGAAGVVAVAVDMLRMDAMCVRVYVWMRDARRM